MTSPTASPARKVVRMEEATRHHHPGQDGKLVPSNEQG